MKPTFGKLAAIAGLMLAGAAPDLGRHGHRRRHRSRHLRTDGFHHGDLRRLLRRVERHAGAAYATHGGDQRHLLGDRRRRTAGRRRRARRLEGFLSGDTLASKAFGVLALAMASVNIFGGFLVTQRMLAMYKKKGDKR